MEENMEEPLRPLGTEERKLVEIPEWDIDHDGYPTEECEDAWNALAPSALSRGQAIHFLRDIFPSVIEQIPCCGIDVSDGTDFCETPVKQIYFYTGGWSGAESVIDAILGQFWIRHFHTQWKRGGAYWFEVPVLTSNEAKPSGSPIPPLVAGS